MIIEILIPFVNFFFSHDIVNPVVPFALRLSSNLMIGVVRIYRKQTQTVWSKYM